MTETTEPHDQDVAEFDDELSDEALDRPPFAAATNACPKCSGL